MVDKAVVVGKVVEADMVVADCSFVVGYMVLGYFVASHSVEDSMDCTWDVVDCSIADQFAAGMDIVLVEHILVHTVDRTAD